MNRAKLRRIRRLFQSVPPVVPGLTLALLASAWLSGCSAQSSSLQAQTPAPAVRPQPLVIEPVELRRVRWFDKNNESIDPNVLSSPLAIPAKVLLYGDTLVGRAPAYEQLLLKKKLAKKLKSELDGTFVYLPWRAANPASAKNSELARVGHYAAIEIPGRKDEILICGGDESPDHVHFAADKTWLVKILAGQVQVELGPQLNFARHNGTLTALLDGKILISGGATPAVEIYDPVSNKVSPDGIFAGAANTLAGQQLANGKILFICPASANRRAAAVSIGQQDAPLTAILYDRVNKDVTEPITLKHLSHLIWLAPFRVDGALLLGHSEATQFDETRLGKPSVELVTTAR